MLNIPYLHRYFHYSYAYTNTFYRLISILHTYRKFNTCLHTTVFHTCYIACPRTFNSTIFQQMKVTVIKEKSSIILERNLEVVSTIFSPYEKASSVSVYHMTLSMLLWRMNAITNTFA